MTSPSNLIDMVGQRAHRLVVLSRAGVGREGKAAWRCRCDCGTIVVAVGKDMRSGNTKSCGCLQVDKARSRAKTGITRTHGRSRSHDAVYEAWRSMIQRCKNPKAKSYSNYGGRGIRICRRWLKFENFLVDMGERPVGMSLDRRNNDKGYSKGNCRWASFTTQSRNKRSNKVVTHQGVSKIIADWARDLNIPDPTLRRRIRVWGVERALNSKPTNQEKT